MNFNRKIWICAIGILLLMNMFTAYAYETTVSDKKTVMAGQDNNVRYVHYSAAAYNALPKTSLNYAGIQQLTHDQKVNMIRNDLDISQEVNISSGTIRALIERNSNDNRNFENIVSASKLVTPENRVKLANHLVGMDKEFVNRFTLNAVKNNQNKARSTGIAKSYISYIEDRTMIRTNIDKTKIRMLFRKEIDTKKFMEMIR